MNLAAFRFVRVPTEVLAGLLRVRMSGVQCRIVLWVIRQTYGWHRQVAPYTWYRIAQELSLDRGGVVRAARKLLMAGVLIETDGAIGIRAEGGAMKSVI